MSDLGQRLTKTELLVLEFLEDLEYLQTFDGIADQLELTRPQAKRATRMLAKKGLTEFSHAFDEDSNLLAGSGYMVTTKGRNHWKELKGLQ